MNWLPGLALAGGILALGPILIHIIFRRRYREVPWAAMRFLLESARRNRQRLRWEEIVVMALRALICVLLGLLLANIRSSVSNTEMDSSTAQLFILDDSFSMSQQVGGTIVFKTAVERIAAHIETLPLHTRVAILNCSYPEESLVPSFVSASELKSESFQRKLKNLNCTDTSARWLEITKMAQKCLEQLAAPAQIILVSDFRKHEFSAENPFKDRIHLSFEMLNVPLALWDFGVSRSVNLTIVDLRRTDRSAVAGIQTSYSVTIKNTGTVVSEPTILKIGAGTAQIPPLEVPTLEPQAQVVLPFQINFDAAGEYLLKAELPSDALECDNFRYEVECVTEGLKIALITAVEPAAFPEANNSFCLQYAIDPSGRGAFGQRAIRMHQEELHTDLLNEMDCIVWDGQSTTTTAVDFKRMLLEYIRSGGGVLIFPDERLETNANNEVFFSDGNAIFPLKIKSLQLRKADAPARIELSSLQDHPSIRILNLLGGAFSQLLRFNKWITLEEKSAGIYSAEAEAPQVLVRLDDISRSPLLIKRRMGKGLVYFCSVSPRVSWTDWPRQPSFLPFVNDLIRSSIKIVDVERSADVNLPLRHEPIGMRKNALSIELLTPRYPHEDPLLLHPASDGALQSSITRYQGVYTIRFRLSDNSEAQTYYVRNIDHREGELAKATEIDIRNFFVQQVDYTKATDSGMTGLLQTQRARSWWPIFLLLLLTALCAEQILACRFGHRESRVGNGKEV